MNERFDKTSICTVLFIDIVNYTKRPVDDQIALKALFNDIVSDAVKNVPEDDLILIDTGDGAAIALLGAPEEALYAAISVRRSIIRLERQQEREVLQVRMGINLGPVRLIKDINDRPNIIGDGMNVAQRVMNFAEPGQILVSRSYYEVTSRLSKATGRVFSYAGMRQDKHVREHELYEVHALSGGSRGTAQALWLRMPHPDKRILWGLLALVLVIVAFWALDIVLDKPASKPQEQAESTEPERQTAEKNENGSLWNVFKSVKQGTKAHQCTQAEAALNQCR